MRTRDDQTSLADRLSDKGVRLTRQRRILLDAIERSSEHLHASDLLRMARERDRRIDRATVYRTLHLLKEQGVVEELDLLHLDGSEHHYELRRPRSHAHIGCIKCGRIMEYETDLVADLETQILRQTGCAVKSVRIEISAICAECRTAD